MKNKILGVIAVLWGSAILAKQFLAPAPATGNAAYEGGKSAGLVMAVLFIVAGIFALLKKQKSTES